MYTEEPCGRVLNHPVAHRLFAHPTEDRFDAGDFAAALRRAGLVPVREEWLWGMIFWCVASKPTAAEPAAPPTGSPEIPPVN